MSDGITASVFSAWPVCLRDLSAKSALLLLMALALTWAMRRASAAARHLVWGLTFAGLLLLPLLSVTLPARSVPVLPWPAASASVSSPVTLPSLTATKASPTPASHQRPALPPALPAWPLLLCRLWLLGVGLAASPLLTGLLLAAQRIRRCSLVTDPVTLSLATEAGRQLGLRRPVSLRSGPLVSVPVTFGLIRPVILLPEEAASWPAERLRVALLHELAHIRRGDWATQILARLACAFFWHNPLVWPAARTLRAEAERACDDRVLASGVPAPDYAQHLLAVTAALSTAKRPLPLAVPMAGGGPLESRLRSILTVHPRRAPSRCLAAMAFLTALATLVPLAVLRPAARAAHRMASPLTLALVSRPAPSQPVPLEPVLPKPMLFKIARRSSLPVKVAVTVLPAPTLAKSTPIGVPPMKPLMPVKTVALAALAATMILPAASALPTTKAQATHPAGSIPAVSATIPSAPASVSLGTNASPVSLALDQISVRDALAMMFKKENVDYTIDQDVSGTVSVHVNSVPFEKALTTLLDASSQPLEYRVQNDVYHIEARPDVTIATGPGTPFTAPNPLVSVDLKKVPIRQALDSLFAAAKVNYTIAPGVPGDTDVVTIRLTDVPLEQALDAVLATSETPLLYTVKRGGIFVVTPKRQTGSGLPF